MWGGYQLPKPTTALLGGSPWVSGCHGTEPNRRKGVNVKGPQAPGVRAEAPAPPLCALRHASRLEAWGVRAE